MDFQGRTVVITGGTGGLGTAVVGALLAAGAMCHIPYLVEAEANAFKHRNDKQATLYPQINLTDEDAVGRFYGQVPDLWASIHLAGGFAAGTIRAAGKSVPAGAPDGQGVAWSPCARIALPAI